jgi:hypothetical protein
MPSPLARPNQICQTRVDAPCAGRPINTVVAEPPPEVFARSAVLPGAVQPTPVYRAVFPTPRPASRRRARGAWVLWLGVVLLGVGVAGTVLAMNGRPNDEGAEEPLLAVAPAVVLEPDVLPGTGMPGATQPAPNEARPLVPRSTPVARSNPPVSKASPPSVVGGAPPVSGPKSSPPPVIVSNPPVAGGPSAGPPPASTIPSSGGTSTAPSIEPARTPGIWFPIPRVRAPRHPTPQPSTKPPSTSPTTPASPTPRASPPRWKHRKPRPTADPRNERRAPRRVPGIVRRSHKPQRAGRTR